MNKFWILIILITLSSTIQSQKISEYEVAKVSFDDFKELLLEVESIRAEKLISLDEFIELSKKNRVVILDARSREKYENRHLQGAVNLPFTEFTEENLAKVIPNKNTKVLIYCNNNFTGDQINFASKTVVRTKVDKKALEAEERELSLALNIPTYITLHGYGYKNIFELNELVDVRDIRLLFWGDDVLEGE